MWFIKILNGTQRGQVFNLEEGVHSIGRSSQNNIQIKSHGISKTHAEIHVNSSEVLILDKNSANGLFINGVKTNKVKLNIKIKLIFMILFVK